MSSGPYEPIFSVTNTTVPTAPTAAGSVSDDDSGLSTGAVIGIVMGVCIAMIIIAILAAVILKYGKKNKVDHGDNNENDKDELNFDNDKTLGKPNDEGP